MTNMTVIDVLNTLWCIPTRLNLHRDDNRPYEMCNPLWLDVKADNMPQLPTELRNAHVSFITFDPTGALRLVIEAWLNEDDFDRLENSNYPGLWRED